MLTLRSLHSAVATDNVYVILPMANYGKLSDCHIVLYTHYISEKFPPLKSL